MNQKTKTYLHRFAIVRWYRLRILALWAAKNMYKSVVRGGNSPIMSDKLNNPNNL